MTEFIANNISDLTSIKRNDNIKYPDFEIITKFKISVKVDEHKWWCVFNFTNPKTNNFSHIRSNFQKLK